MACLLAVKVCVGAVNDVLHQHGHSHGTNSTRDGCDERGNLRSGLVLDITNQPLARLPGLVGNVVCANVDHNSILLQPLALDEACLANRSNDDISALDDRR